MTLDHSGNFKIRVQGVVDARWADYFGETVIEREDDGPMTVRSALELLGSAYALHPAFSEAAILDMGAGVRPAFADNVPRVIIEDAQTIRVNGAYRHGFLLSLGALAAVNLRRHR